MTKKEARNLLNNSRPKGNNAYSLMLNDALDMAIEALEQELCEDTVSRKAVFDALESIGSLDTEEDREYARSVFEELPSVTPKQKIGHWIYDDEYSDWIEVTYKCSCCERAIIIPYGAKNEVYKDYPYCHCGAKMIENEEEFDNLEEMLEKLWNDTESEEERMNIKLDEGAFKPIREHKTDAGLDLRTPEEFVIKPNDSYIIDTGVHIELPKGYYGKLESKSGLNVKHNIVCLGGTIDEPYRGSIVVKLYNVGKEEYHFHRGDKIVQLVIQPYLAPDIEYADKLSETDRGNNGFGSTGK